MLNEILILIGLTLIPALELRGSIPYGIFKTDLHWSIVFLVCVAANILLGPIVYVFLDRFIHLFLRIEWFEKIYNKYVEKTQEKIKKYVDRYGEIGIAVFIGIPLPGSGVYTGALGSYILGLKFKKFLIADIIGVLIAGIIVTIICLTGSSMFQFLIKVI